MKCTTPEISWHNRDPVLSVDVQSGNNETLKSKTFWRVATGGADSHVLIWHLTVNNNGGVDVNCVADLERHQKAVNVVRFSPSKEILASGDDESIIVLWKHKEDSEFFVNSDESNKEQWSSWKVLRGHLEDIYDISWSPDSNSLVSGSVDNTAIMWDVGKGRSIALLSDHKGFVQGVSWDPCNQYICTMSTDRMCRLFDINTKKTVQRVYKSKIPTSEADPLKDRTVRLFYDDTFKSFFRRLTFSPDGKLIIVPSGIVEPVETTERIANATIIFSRYNLKEPIVVLPSLNECTIAIGCCPVYFELKKHGPTAIIPLPYRIVFAVATQHSVFIYDTQQTVPLAAISNIHYTRLTDVAWSSDGRILIVSSTDGYCTIVHFQKGELGVEYNDVDSIKSKVDVKSQLPQNIDKQTEDKQSFTNLDVDCNAMDIDISKNIICPISENTTDANVSRSAINDNPIQAVNTSEKNKSDMDEETEDIKLVYTEESISDADKIRVKQAPQKTAKKPVTSNKTPRRVQLITLSSPKGAKRDDKSLNVNK